MTTAGYIGAGLALGLAMACSARAEEGARAGESLWAAPPEAAAALPASAAAENNLGQRIDELEQSVAELEKIVGDPRGFRPRQTMDRRLDDLEARLAKIEKRQNDLDIRMKRAETRKP